MGFDSDCKLVVVDTSSVGHLEAFVLLLAKRYQIHYHYPSPESRNSMKAETHPNYKQITVTCACGATRSTRSTKDDYTVDVCSECHPFYTGKQRFVDAAGQVERYRRRYANMTNSSDSPVQAEDSGSESDTTTAG